MIKMIKQEDLPDSIEELTLPDVQLLLEAVRLAAAQPLYMNDPESSFRLGWIVAVIAKRSFKLPLPSALMSEWLIWSVEHQAWWKEARSGYTRDIMEAGRYSRASASEICQDANGERLEEFMFKVGF